MDWKIKILLFGLLLECFPGNMALPCAGAEPRTGLRPKIGIALSGGGAKSFAHIGVLKVLEEIGLPIDYISGTSMGAIIGALYSMGYSTQEMEKLLSSLKWPELLANTPDFQLLSMVEKPRANRYLGTLYLNKGSLQLPSGLNSGQNIAMLLSRLTWPVHHVRDFNHFPIPFVCVATDMETGEAVSIREGFLPEALRASASIPTVFSPVRIDGRLLVDGGLVRNLPVQDVIESGADIIIGVDVSAPLRRAEELTSIVAILDQSISFLAAQTNMKQRRLCDVLIDPELDELEFTDFDKAAQFIERGEQAARKMLPQLQALVDSLRTFQPYHEERRPGIPSIDSLQISELKVEGLEKVSVKVVTSQLNLRPPTWVTAKNLEKAINRVYSSQFFQSVTYKLVPSQQGTKLVINVEEKSAILLHFSPRYDSHNEAIILFNATVRNLPGHSSSLSFDVKLGGMTQFAAQYDIHTGLPRGLGVQLQVAATDSLIDLYHAQQRIAQLNVDSFFGSAMLGSFFLTRVLVAAGYQLEFTQLEPRIGQENLKTPRESVSTLLAMLRVDTRNRRIFPSEGHLLHAQAETASWERYPGEKYQKYSLDVLSFFPVSDKISVSGRLQLGSSKGPGVPLQRQYFLGGSGSFYGLKNEEHVGRNVQAFMLGVQYEFLPRRYAILHWNMGNTFEQWSWNPHYSQFTTGGGLTFGAATPLGPIELTVMASNRRSLFSYLQIGFNF